MFTLFLLNRFIAVTQPLKYARHKNSKRVYVMLGLVWLVSIAISSPIALGMNYTERRTPDLCVFYNSDFIIYSSMGSFYIPCVVMVLLYWRIFKAIRDRARKSAKKNKKIKLGNKSFYNNAHTANVIENKVHVNSSPSVAVGGNGAVNPCTTATSVAARTTTSDASATEDNSQRELLPAGNSLKPTLAKTIHEETSFTNYNAQFTTDTDDNSACAPLKSPLSDDTDHVIQNDKSKEFLLSPTSDDGGHIVEYTRGEKDSGYSAPTCVEVETVPVKRINKVLLSPPPPRRQMRLGLITQFPSPKKNAKTIETNGDGSRENSDDKENSGSPAKKSVTKFNFHLRHSKKKKEKLSSRRERKATKTLAIVLGRFIIFIAIARHQCLDSNF